MLVQTLSNEQKQMQLSISGHNNLQLAFIKHMYLQWRYAGSRHLIRGVSNYQNHNF